MITTKADRLLRSLIDAGLSLVDFTILATKVIRIQRDFKTDNEERRERDRLRRQDKLREQHQFEQQFKEEEQRRLTGLAKLRDVGYVTVDDAYPESSNKDVKMKSDQLLILPYSKEINDMKQKQRDCCLTFNIDYDLRLNQQTLEKACRRAKRNIYELRADRFNRPEHRSILSVETATFHNKLKEAIREINKIFLDEKSQQDKRHLQELLTYINQFEGDIDLLMCQMQYEPKVKETILFSPVTTDILDRMNLILYYVRTLAKKISTGDYLEEENEKMDEDLTENLSHLPTKVTYMIKIKTNDEISSSLSDDTNVIIRLHGTHNKSPDIRLIQSIQKTKWQSGQIDLFNIELNYLGDIYAAEIWHDKQYSSWKVDWIEIIDDAANIFRFPLDRLFDQYSDEKKTRFIIQRDTGPVTRLPSKPLKQNQMEYKQIGFSTYTVQVKTGKQPNKVTDSTIFIELKGENGSFAENLCRANSAFKSSVFEPDQLDTFYLIWPHLANIYSLHLSAQSNGMQPLWFCEYVTIEDSQTGNRYKFIVNQLFDGLNSDDPNIKTHLTVYPENKNDKDNKDEKEKPSYLLKLKTGEKGLSNASTLPSINIILKGDKGKSEPYILKSSDNKRKLFQENQTDEFILSSKYYVGSLKTLQLSSNDHSDQWFIDTIIIRDIIQRQDYIFPIYKWMNSQDETKTLTIHPINEQKPDYIVYTRTISSELKGPDRSIKLLVQGDKGKHEMELNTPVTMYNTFQPGHKDEYYVDNIKSLGTLQSIEVDITHPNIKKLGLDYIEIKDCSTNDSYRFNINRMLDSKTLKMTAKAEPISRSTKNASTSSSKTSRNQLLLPNTTNKKSFDQLTTNVPQGAKRPTNNNYQVSVKTGESSLTGTDLQVQLQLDGDKGTSAKIHLNKSETHPGNPFQRNNLDTFSVTIPDIGNLKLVTLSLDGHVKQEWSISTLEIVQGNSNKIYYADINQILGKKGNNELTIHLNEHSRTPKSTSEHDYSEENIYKIKLKTINKQLLNKDTQLRIELINEHGQSEMLVVDGTNTHTNLLQKDQIDTFTIDTTNDFGKLKTVKLSLTGSKASKNDFYQPQFVEIYHPKSNQTYRIDYTKDDLLSSDKNRLHLTKSIKLLARINSREKAHAQGVSASTTNISSKSNAVPYKKLAESILSDHDEEDLSLLNNTTTTSLSKDINSLSDRLTSSSSRQIRPGDRVKNSSKRQLNDHPSTSSTYEADWYRRSLGTNKDHRSDVKQMQLISDHRMSQTKFDQRQAHIIKSQQNEVRPNIQRQLSKDKKVNTDQNAGKQQKMTKTNQLPNRSSISKTQQQLNELQKEMMNDKTPTNSNISQNNQIPKDVHKLTQSSLSKQVQSLSLSTPLTDDRRLMSRAPKTVTDSPISSNISELTNSSPKQLTISTRSSLLSSHLSQKEESNNVDTNSTAVASTIKQNDRQITKTNTYNLASDQSMPVLSKSVPPNSRTSNEMSTRRSASVSSSRAPSNRDSPVLVQNPSAISKDQSQQSNTAPSFSNSNQVLHTPKLASQIPNDSFSIPPKASEENIFRRPQFTNDMILSPGFDKYNSQPNAQAISAVTIHTIATKSDSDSNLTRKSIDSQGSEQSLQSKSLLSPDTAKKSRKNRRREHRQNTSKSVENEIDPAANIKLNKHISASSDKYLSKETSNIQYASRPTSNTAQSDHSSSAIVLQTSNTINKKAQASPNSILNQHHSNNDASLTTSLSMKLRQTAVESDPKDEDISSQSTYGHSPNTSDDTSFPPTAATRSHRLLPNEVSDVDQSTPPINRPVIAKTNSKLPTKLTGVDHMSTVYEESEPSAASTSHIQASSFIDRNYPHENIHDWLETSSSVASSQPHVSLNHRAKTSSNEESLSNQINKSPSPSNHHNKTIDAKTKLTPIRSNTSIDYEFRIQIGNESQFDGTNEPVFIELTNIKDQTSKMPLINSINNSRPFQKGQLDIFHLSVSKNFHRIKKMNLFLPKSNKDPLHVRYCELQDHHTMNTLHFPIEKWLGEKNTYHVEMNINNNNNSLF